MSKNWNNPLPPRDANNAKPLNQHHGLDLDGSQWRALVGIGDDSDGYFYDFYIRYCKLMSSPLGQALA